MTDIQYDLIWIVEGYVLFYKKFFLTIYILLYVNEYEPQKQLIK